jgi:hypothetical protein
LSKASNFCTCAWKEKVFWSFVSSKVPAQTGFVCFKCYSGKDEIATWKQTGNEIVFLASSIVEPGLFQYNI